MTFINRTTGIVLAFFLTLFFINVPSFASDNQIQAGVSNQIFDKVKQNENWKLAFFTGKDAQIVFMNITPATNPANEIGMETHKFDQIIFVVEGNGNAILDGKPTLVKSGDMIFIPQGVAHNVINMNKNKPLKILSVYSATDIPANSTYKKKSDAQD